jgi:23S rRNA-/tRNA-specific pseudouridylate synthase
MKKRRFIKVEEKDISFLTDKETAETYFEIICEKNGLSLVKAFPKTGRFHQIRATLCSLGFPIVGDKTYGLDETLFLRFISDSLTENDYKTMILDRQALHSKSIEFILPSTGKEYKIETDIPQEIMDLFK